jgi:hypothetical protein
MTTLEESLRQLNILSLPIDRLYLGLQFCVHRLQ